MCRKELVLRTSETFFGDYRVPMMHGLLNRKFIQELKLSGTYQADSFARRLFACLSFTRERKIAY